MNRFFKRAFDIVFALAFGIVFSPVYLITAVVIVIVSPGNPLYKAKRVGLHGREFTCYKFRSMRNDSGKVKLTTLRNDDRIFPFGRFIRKTKIDEMPQIFNILSGQMSVVGPRPEDKANADAVYTGKYRHILDVKPGLTGIASLYDFTHGEKYEDETAYRTEFLPQKLELELYYVEHPSFWYDLRLICRTAYTVVGVVCGADMKAPTELRYIHTDAEELVG